MKLYTLLDNEKTLSLPGVYQITNDNTGKFYIGSTIRPLKERISQHFSYLRGGTHQNQKLQNSYNKYGESSFTARSLEVFIVDKKQCQDFSFEREQFWIDLFNSVENGYNINKKVEKPNPRIFTIQDRIEEGLRKSEGGYLVKFPDQEDEYFVASLALFAEFWPKYKLQHSSLTACARGEIGHHRGFRVRFANPDKQVEYIKKYDQGEDTFVLFDPQGKRYSTNNLSRFCREHELEKNRVALLLCAQGKNHHSAGWQCYYVQEAPEEYIPLEQKAKYKKYKLIDPEGKEYITQNLKQFATERQLNENTLRKVASPKYKNKSYRGWLCKLVV